MKNLLIILFYPVFISFNSSMGSFKSGNELQNQNISKEVSKVTYLFFKVEKNEGGREMVVLEGKNTSEGKLKMIPVFDENEAKVGDYIVTLSNSSGKNLVKELIEDPLNPMMEVFGENISRKQLSLQKAEFSIRFNHSDEISVLKVEKITKAGNQILLNQKL